VLSNETCTVQGLVREQESEEKETIELTFEILHERIPFQVLGINIEITLNFGENL
jgi:hypothetical protein